MRARLGIMLVLTGTAAAAVVARAQSPSASPASSFLVIVHPTNPATSIDRKLAGELFLKKATRWPHDEVARPVDASARSAVRRRFSQDVLRRSVAAVKSYWQQLVFSGRGVPPPELDSDDAIVGYVLRNRGAIGYVSGTANLRGAKVVQVR